MILEKDKVMKTAKEFKEFLDKFNWQDKEEILNEIGLMEV